MGHIDGSRLMSIRHSINKWFYSFIDRMIDDTTKPGWIDMIGVLID
jgi:hypothetical protein